jgi:hypothetical protein
MGHIYWSCCLNATSLSPLATAKALGTGDGHTLLLTPHTGPLSWRDERPRIAPPVSREIDEKGGWENMYIGGHAMALAFLDRTPMSLWRRARRRNAPSKRWLANRPVA